MEDNVYLYWTVAPSSSTKQATQLPEKNQMNRKNGKASKSPNQSQHTCQNCTFISAKKSDAKLREVVEVW